MDRASRALYGMDRDLVPENSEIQLLAIVRDKYGRICLDESVFYNDDLLLEIAKAVKDGGNTSGSDS